MATSEIRLFFDNTPADAERLALIEEIRRKDVHLWVRWFFAACDECEFGLAETSAKA